MRKHLSARLILLTLLGLALVASVGIAVSVLLSGPGCLSPILLSRRDCLLLRAPTIWFAPDRAVALPQPEVIAPLPVPPGEDPAAIQDPMPSAQVTGLASENSGGFIGLRGTWSALANDYNNLSVVPEGEAFVGEFEMGLYMPEPPVYIVTCLVDFVQRPCAPGAPLTQTIALDSEQIARVPIEIHGLRRGLHDLAVVRWEDLGAERANRGDPDIEKRGSFFQVALRRSLAVGGDTTPLSPTYARLPIPLYYFGLEGLAVSTRAVPWEKMYGGFESLWNLQARSGQPLKLYLHLLNTGSIRVDYALAAFLDQQQVPITYRQVPHTPLYVTAKAGAWYPLPIEITAPKQPGRYELVILGEPFPTARIDMERPLFGDMTGFSLEFGLWTSYRIFLDVRDAP